MDHRYLRHEDVLVGADTGAVQRTLYEMRAHAELDKARDVLELACIATRVIRRLGFSDCCLVRIKDGPRRADDDGSERSGGDPWIDPPPSRHPRLQTLVKKLGIADACYLPLRAADATPALLLMVACRGETAAATRHLAARQRSRLQALTRVVAHIMPLRFPAFWQGQGNGGDKTLVIVPELLQLLSLLARNDLRFRDAGAVQGFSLRATRRRLTLLRRALGTRTVCGGIAVAMDQGLI